MEICLLYTSSSRRARCSRNRRSRSSCRRKPLSDGVRSALDSRNILIEYIDKHQFLRFGIMETEKTALLFKALGDENRLRILKLVSQGEDLCACRILDELDITQPTLSHHMKILKDAGLILSLIHISSSRFRNTGGSLPAPGSPLELSRRASPLFPDPRKPGSSDPSGWSLAVLAPCRFFPRRRFDSIRRSTRSPCKRISLLLEAGSSLSWALLPERRKRLIAA